MFSFLYTLFFQHHASTLLGLELLPDELLLELLSYLSISDLFYGWLNLNWRFNVILHNLPIRKIYSESKSSWWQQWWYSWRSPIDAEPLRYFALQLVSLQTHKHLSSAVANEINILDYPHLRKLVLRQPTPSQLDVIREHNFSHLNYLSLVDTRNFSFEILCQFKLLRSCELMSLQIDDQCSCSSSSIRSLILHKYEPSCLVHLLRHLPQLTFLKLNILWRNTLADKFDSTTTFVHPNLMSLNITMIHFDFSNNESNADGCGIVVALLNLVSPRVGTRCHLNLFGMSNFNFEQLQRAVLEHNFFRFSCRLFYFLKFHSLPNFDRIQQLALFHQLKPICTFPDVVNTYQSTWTNTYHAFLK